MIKPDKTLIEARQNETAFLRFLVPKKLDFSFFRDYEGKEALPLPEPEITGKHRIYTFPNLPAGFYSYETTGEGYYSIHRNVSYTARKKEFDVTIELFPFKRAGTGYEINEFCFYTAEETEKFACPSEKSDFPGCESVLDTPYFTRKSRKTGAFQATTREEALKYLEKNLKNCSAVRTFTAGYSEKYKIPLDVYVFSKSINENVKLPTLKAAAKLLKKNGLPTVLYGARIHGKEPAGTEGALAIMKALAGAYGESLLNHENVVVIPWQNPDGAYEFIRKSPSKGKDMNRDHLRTESKEIRIVHDVFNTFLPEVFIDGHEYYAPNVLNAKGGCRISDALIGTGAMVNNGAELLTLGKNILKATEQALCKNGLQANYYPRLGNSYSTLNSQNPTTGRSYFSMNGTAVFLVESRGLGMGLHLYERRVVTQYIAVEAILNEVAKRSAEVMEIVAKERKRLTETGLSFSPENRFTLSVGKDPEVLRQVCRLASMTTGAWLENREYLFYTTTTPLLSVARPTAYVIPLSTPKIREIKKILKAQHIAFEEIPGPCTLTLRRYKEAPKKEAELRKNFYVSGNEKPGYSFTEPRKYAFPEGVLFLKTAQLYTNVLSYLMEPVCSDAGGSETSFYSMNLLPLKDTYRSET